ncbi:MULTISPECIES: hypothetical protein [Catenuloplanes]|uniref:Uncharacterized protein n=1 Tax=Catenuloplanes niger TaxID=587534 RepID=A0AAE3ZL12_9ACTN|nr:hypothetical protein [Catenuloplanes niger]MDR7320852.1 hypothetical protein [Catenuloplanes niger]
MQSAWLNKDDHFAPGRELFRSERDFSVWAYTVSHGQLLLRSGWPSDAGAHPTRIDLLFKPVQAVKSRMNHSGLVVRCATDEEHERIIRDSGLKPVAVRVFVIESGDALDYVVSGAVGWQEDDQAANAPSALAFFAPATDPTRILPTDVDVPWSSTQAAQLPE